MNIASDSRNKRLNVESAQAHFTADVAASSGSILRCGILVVQVGSRLEKREHTLCATETEKIQLESSLITTCSKRQRSRFGIGQALSYAKYYNQRAMTVFPEKSMKKASTLIFVKELISDTKRASHKSDSHRHLRLTSEKASTICDGIARIFATPLNLGKQNKVRGTFKITKFCNQTIE